MGGGLWWGCLLFGGGGQFGVCVCVCVCVCEWRGGGVSACLCKHCCVCSVYISEYLHVCVSVHRVRTTC